MVSRALILYKRCKVVCVHTLVTFNSIPLIFKPQMFSFCLIAWASTFIASTKRSPDKGNPVECLYRAEKKSDA